MDVTGRKVGISLPRLWIEDLLRHAHRVPTITFTRRMQLAEVAAARASLPNAPGWVLLFVKAYAIVAARRPELRRAYVPHPWPHLYQCDDTIASVALEREYRGEPAVFFGLMKNPENWSLDAMADLLAEWKHKPIEEIHVFRRLIAYTKLPRPMRRVLWWYAMQTSGRKRARNFGTFGISVTASMGATALNLITPLTTTLNYGQFDEAANLDVRLHFDHRVLDGAPVARALVELEQVLNGEIAAELRAMASPVPRLGTVKAVDIVKA